MQVGIICSPVGNVYNDFSHCIILDTKILPGLTHAATKFNFSNKDCMLLNEAVSLFNHVANNNFISRNLSGVTSTVIFSVLNKTPIKVLFSSSAVKVHDSKGSVSPYWFHLCQSCSGMFSS